MQQISVQMIDRTLSCDWWKALVQAFVKEGAALQLRCWNEETDEISQARQYGPAHVEGHETCIDGVVSAAFLDALLHAPEPEDQSIYHKMTRYFTIQVSDGPRIFESAHYGTELFLVLSPEEAASFDALIAPYAAHFSIWVEELP